MSTAAAAAAVFGGDYFNSRHYVLYGIEPGAHGEFGFGARPLIDNVSYPPRRIGTPMSLGRGSFAASGRARLAGLPAVGAHPSYHRRHGGYGGRKTRHEGRAIKGRPGTIIVLRSRQLDDRYGVRARFYTFAGIFRTRICRRTNSREHGIRA